MKKARLDPVDGVAMVLQAHGLGRGLTVAQVRRLYPREHVRRVALLEALRKLEALGAVRWNGDHACWVGPLDVEARPMGIDLRKFAKDLEATPQERVARSVRLSEALLGAGS